MGKEIATLKSSAHQTEIDAEKLSAGMYFLNYNSAGKSCSLKFIKR